MESTEIVTARAEHTGGNGGALTRSPETAAVAAAETARATVQARYIVAYQRPRDMDDVRVKLIKECKRPGFAAVARYAKPQGGKSVEGPSVRFAESAARLMGNIDQPAYVVFEDEEKRIVRVTATDLETNTTYSQDIMIAKTVERRKVKEGAEVLGTRQNSYGDRVYIVRATEDELKQKEDALSAKVRRNLILRLVPRDIVDECMSAVIETTRNADAQDPDGARKRLVDGFASVGVRPSDLKDYLGRDLEGLAPADVDDLRKVFVALKDGETSWRELLEAKQSGGEKKSDTRTSKLKEQVSKAAEKATREPGSEG